MRALAAQLEARGLDVGEPDMDDYGWAVTVEKNGAVGHVQVGLSPEADDTWALRIVEPSGGGPGARPLLVPLHDALTSVEGVERYPRERMACGDVGEGADGPVD